MAAVLEKIHGAKPKVVDYTEADAQAVMKEQPFGAISAAYRVHWAKGRDAIPYENEQKLDSAQTFEQTARSYT